MAYRHGSSACSDWSPSWRGVSWRPAAEERSMVDSKARAAVPHGGIPLEQRMRRADLWEAGADQRERLADERERLADEREALADERDALADRHEQALDRRDADRRDADRLAHASSIGDVDEVAQAGAALHRAEAAVRRAEAELVQARPAAARAGASAARRAAASERTAAAKRVEETIDADERAWLADRRDFVAAERDNQADQRDKMADQRDEAAGSRERLADDRERALLERERRIEQRRSAGHRASATRPPDSVQPRIHADVRAHGERQRERAAASRWAAAQDRARAAAVWGPQAYGPMLMASFAQLARQLFGTDELGDVLPQVLKFTVDGVAGCDWASITLCRHERIVDEVASDPVAAELDEIQFATGIGPGPEAMHSENPVYVPDLVESPRWPVLAETAAQLGVSSALCHGLFVQR